MADEVARIMTEKFRVAAEAARQSAYVTRGRAFAGLSDEALKARFVEGFRAWAADIGNTDVERETADLEAEFQVRGQPVPAELVAAEVRAIAEAQTAIVAGWSPDERAAANARIAATVASQAEN